MLTVTGLYAGLLALIYVGLSFRVEQLRNERKIGFGDGGDKDLMRAILAQGNFAEYVPLALVLMALAEAQSMSVWLIHACGILLLIGRAAHVLAFSDRPEAMRLRILGMALTFTVLTVLALMLVLRIILL